MGIFFAITAAFFCTFSNYCLKRAEDYGGKASAAVMVQMIAAFITMVLLNPVRAHSYSATFPLLSLGFIAGLLLGTMLLFIGKAIEKGPASLTFAAISSSTALPSVFLFLLVGDVFALEYHFWHAIGSVLVIAGLFWAAWHYSQIKEMRKWLVFVFAAFSLHILFLMLISVRSLLMRFSLPIPIFTTESLQSLWFMPMIYLSSALIQVCYYILKEKKMPSRIEWLIGSFGGIANAFSTFFVIKSSETASPIENAMIFPIFSVLVMVFCYAWGQKLYQEKVNWKACNLSIVGLVVGTVDWQTVFK